MTAQSFRLRAGIIAAGRGDRLRSGGPTLKPLVEVGGLALIDRVLGSLAEAGASEVVVIVNADSLAVRDHVDAGRWPFTVRWIVETTPSSMHSFLRVLETLAEDGDKGPFVLSTVDTVAAPGAFSRFVAGAAGSPAVMTLALSRPGDDDTPLRVRLGEDGRRVVAIGDAAGADTPWVTAGVYAVRASALDEAAPARAEGLTALRLFLGRLLARGHRVDGLAIDETVDVDRPGDVAAAERFLKRVTA